MSLKKRVEELEARHPAAMQGNQAPVDPEEWLYSFFRNYHLRLSGRHAIAQSDDEAAREIAIWLNEAFAEHPEAVFFPMALEQAQQALVAFEQGDLLIETKTYYSSDVKVTEVTSRLGSGEQMFTLARGTQCAVEAMNEQFATRGKISREYVRELLRWRIDHETTCAPA